MIFETTYFSIKYSKKDEPCIKGLGTFLDDKYSELSQLFDQLLIDKVNVEVFFNHDDLLKALECEGKWIRGGIKNNRILIASPLNPPWGSKYENVVNTIIHELIHLLIYEINKPIPKWLDEGTASFLGQDNNLEWIKRTVRESVTPTISSLDTGNDYSKFFQLNGYQYSYTLVEFLVNRFGLDTLIKVIYSPKDFEEILGVKKDIFELEWKKFLVTYEEEVK